MQRDFTIAFQSHLREKIMRKFLLAGLTFLAFPTIGYTQTLPMQNAGTSISELAKQGATPFIPPRHYPPEQGVAAFTDDPAYPKYLAIYDAIQVNYGSRQRLQTIEQQISQLQKDYPKSPYPLFALAEVKYAAGAANRSDSDIRAVLEQALDLGGGVLPDKYILDAKMAADEGFTHGALASAQLAVRFAPQKPEAQFALGRAQQINHHIAEAEQAYRAFISLEDNPKRKANGYTWLALALSDRGFALAERTKYRVKARDAWRQSAELDPNYGRLMEYGDFLLTAMGDTAEAGAVFDKLLKQYQDNGSVRFRMALIDYVKWARTGPKGATAAALKAVETRTGLPSEYVFAFSAAYDGLGEITQTMLRARLVKNVNTVCDDSPFDVPEQATALDMAAFNDNMPLVKELSEHGASVNSATASRKTPLLYALEFADVDMTAYLLKKGARVNVTSENGESPMTVALRSSPASRQLTGLLLKYHADPMALNSSGMPAPFEAVMQGNLEGLDVLITEGKVSVETRDSSGTLLSYASENPAMLRYLLSKGANPWTNYGGQDLLEAMRSYPFIRDKDQLATHAECIAILEEARKNRPQQ